MTSSLSAIRSSLSEIIILGEDHHCAAWEIPRRFTVFAKRLQLLINQVHRWLSSENIPASIRTSLKGIAADLEKAAETLAVYKNKSKIFVLINCQALCASLQEHTLAIGGWLALLHSALDQLPPELQLKVADLSSDMKQAYFTVTENEERVFQALQKEGQGRQTSKAVQSAIVMDLARTLGIESNNHAELSEQVKLLRSDLSDSGSDSDRRVLASIERILDYWLIEPDFLAQKLDLDFEEEAQVLPFKNFLCPLTKEVMKDPVVLESAQTYEHTAIEYWFERCVQDGRKPTCPVTGMVLNSLELKPNIGLAGAIEEWVNRSIGIHVKSSVRCLSEESPSVDAIEQVMDRIYKISEENPASRSTIRNAGVILLVVGMLKSSSKRRIGSRLRGKALMVLVSMAKDDESKTLMLEEGTTRLAIHSLIGSSEKEREYAVKLLLEFSSNETYCVKLASEKGALVLLSSMADNRDSPSLSKLAESVLKRMERMEDNIKDLAVAGRFEPLLKQLHEGSDDVKVDMASILGSMTLTGSSKEKIARQGATILVELLWKPEGRAASLQALHNLSSLDDNATILVDSGVLPALTYILFETQIAVAELKELAAAIIANVVANPGHWELASADMAGNLMHSQLVVSNFLVFLPRASPLCQLSILQILYRTASSPQASESVTSHIKSGDGIKTVVRFLKHPQVEHRTYAFRITRILSERLSEDLANEIRASHQLVFLKDKILDSQSTDSETSDSACILANITLLENEVKTILGTSFVKWIVTFLKDQQHTSSVRNLQPKSSMVEGLLGILLHFMRNHDFQTASIVKELHLMSILRDQLISTSVPRVKQLAALGLGCLSQAGKELAAGGESEREPSKWFCSSLVFMCAKASAPSSSCPIHNATCEEDRQLCLLRSNCIAPLVDVLKDKEVNVQVAAVEALSTLLPDTSGNGFKRAVDELDHLGVVDALILLFIEARGGELQEKAIWMVEGMLRSESLSVLHSLNQDLVRSLVEALKHGSNITKRHAQGALTNLKQISGVSAKTSSHN